MKTIRSTIIFVLVLALLTSVIVPDTAAASEKGFKPSVLYNYVDERSGTKEESTHAYEDTVLYVFVNKDISYCAQMSTYGKIQFSYILSTSSDILESAVFKMEDVYKKFSLDPIEDVDFVKINRMIIANLDEFRIQKTLAIADASKAYGDCDSEAYEDRSQVYSSLAAAISGLYGSNYTNVLQGSTNRTLNGVTYTVRCKETQTTSQASGGSQHYDKYDALTSVVSWAFLGGWLWQGLLEDFLMQVISTMMYNGTRVVSQALNATRTNVSGIRTRRVTVDGVSGTQYYAGWTRKRYFIGGNLGWVYDSGYNYNVKHDDYDSVTTLLNKGWNSFVNGSY